MRRLQNPVRRFALCGTARTAALLAMTLVAATSTLAAQGRRRGAAPDQSAPPRVRLAPTLWEPEQLFPLAVSHAGDLKLTDDQRVQIETIASKLRAANAPLMVAIDTLKPDPIRLPDPDAPRERVPTPPPPTPEQIAAIVARRHALGDARAQVHENIRLARDQMTALLTPDQQARLAVLEDKARTAAERGEPGESGGRDGEGRGGRSGGTQGPPRS